MKKIRVFGYNEFPILEYVKKQFHNHNGYRNLAFEVEKNKEGNYFHLVTFITPDIHDQDFIDGIHFWAGVHLANSWKDEDVREEIRKLRNINDQ